MCGLPSVRLSSLRHQARARGKFLIYRSRLEVSPDLPRARLSCPCLLDRYCYFSLFAASKDACVASDCHFCQVAVGDARPVCHLLARVDVACGLILPVARRLGLYCSSRDRWSSHVHWGNIVQHECVFKLLVLVLVVHVHSPSAFTHSL